MLPEEMAFTEEDGQWVLGATSLGEDGKLKPHKPASLSASSSAPRGSRARSSGRGSPMPPFVAADRLLKAQEDTVFVHNKLSRKMARPATLPG